MYWEHGTAGEPGAIAGVSGCWRVEGGVKGVRSPFWCLGVACASKHEGCMNGLCLAPICVIRLSMYEYIRFIRHRKVNSRVLIFATELKFAERATQSEHQYCQAGERGPR